jgi:hypothetical protein
LYDKLTKEGSMKWVLAAVLTVGLASLAFAAAEWQEGGTKVNVSEALNFKNGPDVSGNGTVTDVDFATETGDKTIVGTLTVDGTIYTAKVTVDGAIYPGRATVDPCGTVGRGYIFVSSAGVPCYCDALSVDRTLYGTSPGMDCTY